MHIGFDYDLACFGSYLQPLIVFAFPLGSRIGGEG